MIRTITAVLLWCMGVWMLCFVCFGFTARGKPMYMALASHFFAEEDAAVPLMNIGFVIMLSGTLATAVKLKSLAFPRSFETNHKTVGSQPWALRYWAQLRNNWGDFDFRRFTIYFICWPFTLMLLGNIYRRVYGKELSLDDQLIGIGNSFGSIALVAVSYFLIPVARASPILRFFQLNPVAALRVHIWSGRIVIFGVLLHGAFHVYRWKVLAGESISKMLVPPTQCWSYSHTSQENLHCQYEGTECTCYHIFRNLVGVIAMLALVILGVTSLNYVRRTNYRLFYLTHVMAGPGALLCMILHWRKSIMYIAPSILYYMATSFPVMSENRRCLEKHGGVQLKKLDRLQFCTGGRERECMSLTLSATPSAVSSYCAGQYVKLVAPEISFKSHPFTINRVPGKKDELRIIFRVIGKFTHKLSDRIVKSVNGPLPAVAIDGFHGSELRVAEVLKHDVSVIVAGGIGITPYLSLLHDVHEALASTELNTTKEVVLHWVCREEELIRYVKNEYFDPLLAKPHRDGFKLTIVVNKTVSSASVTGDQDVDIEAQLLKPKKIPVKEKGVAFNPSLFSNRTSRAHYWVAVLTFMAIGWVGFWCVLALYHYEHAKTEMVYRIWSPICLVSLGILVSWTATWVVSGSFKTVPTQARDASGYNEVPDASSSCKEESGHDWTEDVTPTTCMERTVTFDLREGERPTVHALLKHLDTAHCPGLFMCGPSNLVHDLKLAAEERCEIRRCQCTPGEPNIAVYEEHFEM